MSPDDPDAMRPSPEALLRSATREGRGRLKVFLGAAPGVGKTYEMMREGAERQREGADVVIAVVETHGRADTEALTRDIEILPRRPIAYEGHRLTEMDLDAVLARRPRIALVDELAHTNAPGSRHEKRWQDIEELLDAGIHVYSTLNIQHIESLNDVVASFTKVRVRETLPDHVLDDAEIEVVDIPPDDLIERLKAGKVYIPDEASRALNHFFSKSNLSALRELALRRAAQAVDAQMLDYLRSHALVGTYAGGERILVAVGEHPGADALVRAAKRLADALRAPWTALHIETPREARFTDAERTRLAANLGLAATLGATMVTVPARSVFDGLTEQIVASRATQLVLGKSQRSWWFELRHGSVVDKLVRQSSGVAVHVLPLGESEPADHGRRTPVPERWQDYLWSLIAVAAMVLAGRLIEPLIGYRSTDLLFLIPTIGAATLYGLRKGVAAGIASGLAYNFFFIPPRYTLTIYEPENVVTFFVLIFVAVLTSQLAGRVKAQAEIGARSARENAAIAGFARTLGGLSEQGETARTVCAEIARLMDVNAMLLSRSDGALVITAAYPGAPELSAIDNAAADWAWERGEAAGRGTGTLTASEWRFHPLRTALGTLAVLGVSRSDAGNPVPATRAVLFMSLVDQAALAHERLKLEDDMREVVALKQRDQLRGALLSSIAHDLKTPLTAVTAGVEALEAEPDSAQLLSTIRAETQRLRRFFDDLIDMTRIEAGAIHPQPEATDLTDAIASAVHDVKGAREGRKVRLDVPVNLPLVRTDPSLLHHILINLIDNAAKFSGEGTEIRIEGRRERDGLRLAILDQGPGLPPGREEELFGTFTRVEGSDRTGGTGLGLAIVRGFSEALGIEAHAANRRDATGAIFSLHFPQSLIIRPKEQPLGK